MAALYLRFPGGKSKALTFSYDDGVSEDIRLINIFRENGLKGTFNINSGLFGPESGENTSKWKHRRLSLSEVKRYYTDDVCEVACHCVTHADLPACDTASACLEVLNDRLALESIFGRQIHGMAYPYGTYNDSVVNILRNAGIYYARTTVSTLKFSMPTDWLRLPATCHHKNPALNELADRFISLHPNREPQMFYVWGHSYEFNDDNNWDLIENFSKKISGRDDIWYAKNIELYYAWLDYQRLEYTADGSKVYNPGQRSVWLANIRGETFEVKPGETLTI